jgi:hypothetical protein
MANIDRAEIVELLGRLGAPEQDTVVAAARELDRKVSEAGLTWDDLLSAELGRADGHDQREEAASEAAPAGDPPAAGGALRPRRCGSSAA